MVNMKNVSIKELKEILKEKTKKSPYKWYIKRVPSIINETKTFKYIIGNDYFSAKEYYELYESEEDYLSVRLYYEHNGFTDTLEGFIVDPNFAFSDYNDFNKELACKFMNRVIYHFEHYV